ncbi:MAG: glycosyltransferase [Sphingomicrobium sp.]
MPGSTLIQFVHEGKAAYPELRAMQDYFAERGYETTEVRPDGVFQDRARKTVCWHMMGFYPRRLDCTVSIHDYRSLSVGRLARTKDRLKRLLNARPDIRIFQNQDIRQALGFIEDDQTRYLPMGVPQPFIEQRGPAARPAVDFIYIGSMLAERRCELMLDSFLKRFGDTSSFDLYGPPNDQLVARYSAHSNIRFRGTVAQAQLPAILCKARVGVCYFPMHYPHLLQTPTKLMEYAALGMRILANDHPQSRITAQQYGLECAWGSNGDMFEAIPAALDWPDNMAVDPRPMEWNAVISASGVEQALAQALDRTKPPPATDASAGPHSYSQA